MKKHLFFDMDGTVTESSSKIDPRMSGILLRLLDQDMDIVIVSGARYQKMTDQLGFVSEYASILAQNGNYACNSSGSGLWARDLNWIQKLYILRFINDVIEKMDIVGDLFDRVQDRGCQISLSLTGHSAPLSEKVEADPDSSIRLSILKDGQHRIDELNSLGIRVAVGGTTTIDFYTHDKGQNIKELINNYQWNIEDCIYFGDALFPGGNDFTVNGIIETVKVDGPEDLMNKLKEYVQSIREE